MILGLSVYHDASVCIADDQGRIIVALSEERFTRKKHDAVFPHKSLSYILEKFDAKLINQVCVAGFSKSIRTVAPMQDWIFRTSQYKSFDGQREYRFPPNMHRKGPIQIEDFKSALVETLNKRNIDCPINLIDHHLAHAFSAIVPSTYESGVVLTLDGEGDGNSGLVAEFQRDKFVSLGNIDRISSENSLGNFYSATTKRYNFKPYSHEGKITGLAATTQAAGECYEFLSRYIRTKHGLPHIRTPKNRILRTLKYGLRRSGLFPDAISEIQDIVDSAANRSSEFAELASATQKILEEVVLDIIKSNFKKLGRQNYVLAGGVFSNVSLNRRIAESDLVNQVYVYPNMGDGGLSVGAVFEYVSRKSDLGSPVDYLFDPYVGNELLLQDHKEFLSRSGLCVKEVLNNQDWFREIAKKIMSGEVVGLIQGKMEFGPRALMNRSILARPTERRINDFLNLRLRRTEFMPFAPVVKKENLSRVFDVSKIKDLSSFSFMTMTCLVREEWRELIPAVVHVDGTARPQAVDFQVNPIAWKILDAYEELTGLPVLINTSFNVHEEPIVCGLEEVIASLKDGIVDSVVTPNLIISKLS